MSSQFVDRLVDKHPSYLFYCLTETFAVYGYISEVEYKEMNFELSSYVKTWTGSNTALFSV